MIMVNIKTSGHLCKISMYDNALRVNVEQYLTTSSYAGLTDLLIIGAFVKSAFKFIERKLTRKLKQLKTDPIFRF